MVESRQDNRTTSTFRLLDSGCLLVLLPILIVVGAAFLLLSRDDPVRPYERGQTFYEAGDFPNAITSFTRAIEADASFVAAYINRGFAYWQIANLGQAQADFERALTLQPGSARAQLGLGLVMLDTDDPRTALRYFDRALANQPPDEQAARAYTMYQRAIAYLDIDKLPAAEADLEQALVLDPSTIDAYWLLGNIYERTGRYQDALNAFITYVGHLEGAVPDWLQARIDTLTERVGAS